MMCLNWDDPVLYHRILRFFVVVSYDHTQLPGDVHLCNSVRDVVADAGYHVVQ